MSRPEEKNLDAQLEAYLDGAMTPDARRAFETLLRRRPEMARQVALQAKINDSLTKLHAPPARTADEIEAFVAQTSDEANGEAVPPPNRSIESEIRNSDVASASDKRFNSKTSKTRSVASQSNRRIVLVSLAAAVAWAIVGWRILGGHDGQLKPFFKQQPLPIVYSEILNNGFKPYYECHDGDRFAATIQKRQGIELHLGEMPAGTGMLGLSYAGGLSRDTTAILCRVDDQPVVVFVDRINTDSTTVSANQASDLNVFRREAGTLVMYEVSPLQASRVLEYLHIRNTSIPE